VFGLETRPPLFLSRNRMEKKMKTIITTLVALVIGAGGMYFYQQGSMKQLQTAAAALETQLSEAKTAA
jgi:uncharacterized protein HemX